jgi:hypothetical protein
MRNIPGGTNPIRKQQIAQAHSGGQIYQRLFDV